MVDIQHTDLTGSSQLHPPLSKTFTGAPASYTPDAAAEIVMNIDSTPYVLYATTGVTAGDVIQIGSVAIESRDEGGSLTTETAVFDFVGAGVTATEAAGVVTVTIPGGGGGGSIEVEDEAVSLTTAVTKFNFVGAGITATEPVTDEITVTVPGNPLEVSDEGISLTGAAIELDFVGAGVTATEAAGIVTVTIPGGGGGSIEVEDEGVSLTTAVTKFDFAGAGVTVTEPVADEVLVTIPGGGSALEVEDEAVSLSTAVTKINFAGAGVTATEPVTDEILVTIPGGTSGLEVEDEAVSLSTAVSKINFAGAGVTATEPVADEILVTIPGGGGASIEVEDEGVSLTTAVTKFNFVGAGVTVTEPVADEVTVTITGGGGGSTVTAMVEEVLGSVTTTGSQASVTFSSIDQTCEDLILRVEAQSDVINSEDSLLIELNGDTTVGNYFTQYWVGSNGVVFGGEVGSNTIAFVNGGTSPGPFTADITLRSYTDTSAPQDILTIMNAYTVTSSKIISGGAGSYWNTNAAVTSIDLKFATGNFTDGFTVKLIGRKEVDLVTA